MLKAMDAILFGPPVYDNTLKDFALFLSILIAIVASVTVMQLKRQNSKIEVGCPRKLLSHQIKAQLSMEHDRIQQLDEGWSDLGFKNFSVDFNWSSDLNRQISEGSELHRNSSANTLTELPRQTSRQGSLKWLVTKAWRLSRTPYWSLSMLSSGTTDGVICEKARLLLYTCYRTEKQQLSIRKEEALRIKANAKEAFDRLQKSNQSLILGCPKNWSYPFLKNLAQPKNSGSIRIIHSPTQLQSIDASIREARVSIIFFLKFFIIPKTFHPI